MIFAKGTLLPDHQLPNVLCQLEEEIDRTLSAPALPAEMVVAAVDALGRRLADREFDALLASYLPAGTDLSALLPLLRRETLEQKLRTELGPDLFPARGGGQTTPRPLPLGVLLHVTAGNMPGLPVYSALEGLLTGNVNLIKLPHGDKGLSLAALKLLVEQEPALADFLYAFDLSSSAQEELGQLAALADGIVTWGGERAVTALRRLAPAGCRLIEWGHRLSFAYICPRSGQEEALSGLARHTVETGQRLCSSCQVIFLDTADWSQAGAFCQSFLPLLEAAAARRADPGGGAQSTLSGYTARLERISDGRSAGECHFPGRGCSVTLRPDRELELSPLEGNVLVKCLPREELFSALRRKKGVLQTAGLLCSPGDREELTGLLSRAGVTRITPVDAMSASLPGQAHDGEYPLRRYLRMVDITL